MFQPRNEKRGSQEITSTDLPPKSDPEAVLSADKPEVSQAHVTSQQVKFSFAILTEKVSATSIIMLWLHCIGHSLDLITIYMKLKHVNHDLLL